MTEDVWVRCEDCGRKIHHKKIWNPTKSKGGGFEDVDDKDKPHLCNVCEHLRIKKEVMEWQ